MSKFCESWNYRPQTSPFVGQDVEEATLPQRNTMQTQGVFYSVLYLFWRRNPRRCCQAISQLLILSPSSDTPLSKWHQHETEMNAIGQVAPIKAPVRDEGCRMLWWICPVALNEVIYFSSSPSASKQEASTRPLGHVRCLVALWLNHWG